MAVGALDHHDDHPALYASMELRVAYARIVGAIVAADHTVTVDEVRNIRELCRRIGVPPETADEVVDHSHAPDPIWLRDLLDSLRTSDLRYTLVTDMVALGHADGVYDLHERRAVRQLAAIMLVGEHEVRAIEDDVVHALGHAPTDPEPEPPAPSWTQGIASGIATMASSLGVRRLSGWLGNNREE